MERFGGMDSVMDISDIFKELGARIGSLEVENTILRAELTEAKALLESKEDDGNGDNDN